MTDPLEAELATDIEPQEGDWVFEIDQDGIYVVNNGVGRVNGYGPLVTVINSANPEGRPVYFHDTAEGSYHIWDL